MATQYPPPPALRCIDAAALFLDFDGTLVDLAEAPDAIRVRTGTVTLLQALSDLLAGRLALVSGRSLADLARHIGNPAIALAGSHGGELRLPGEADAPLPATFPRAAHAAAVEFAAACKGVMLETKTLGFALHYRLAPNAEADVQGFAAGLADMHRLAVKHGKMVVELTPPGIDKGKIVGRLMQSPPFLGSTPVFVGDDITDEDGFAAAAAAGGLGILVGAPRETRATACLPGVADVHDWLRAAI